MTDGDKTGKDCKYRKLLTGGSCGKVGISQIRCYFARLRVFFESRKGNRRVRKGCF